MTTPSSLIIVPALLGPTASGKTALALQIAEEAGMEIVSCDSRQIYRFMDIGTAKPRKEELSRVKHWLVDIRDPAEQYSASAFVNDAGKIVRVRAESGKRTLLCGGTGLYFESFRNGLGPQVASDPALRDALARRAAAEGSEVLHRELSEKDPEAAVKIHAQDSQRTIRALAVYYQTGKKISEMKTLAVPPRDLEFRVAVLMPPRELLYEMINHRVDGMLRQGLWDEFIMLRGRGYDGRTPGLQCVGYQELFAVEQGACSLDEATEKIKRNTRRYAKRQMTWFRAHNRGSIIEHDDNVDVVKKRIIAVFGGTML